MILNTRLPAYLAALGSLGLLLGAFGFQFLAQIHPCPMCLWQRWPHALGALLGVAVLVGLPKRLVGAVGAVTMAVSFGLGLYHSGVERDWWEGPTTCTSGDITNLSADQLMAQIMSAPVVRCDEIAWSMFGLTMPNYNALISLALLGLWLIVATRKSA